MVVVEEEEDGSGGGQGSRVPRTGGGFRARARGFWDKIKRALGF